MLASLTSHLTDGVARHGLIAVFCLMAIDAVLPAGGEVIMLYGGVVAGTTGLALFGADIASGPASYVAVAAAGTLGYLAGSVLGWIVGARGGRPFVERHGRWLHLRPATLDKAERWFERHGSSAVFLGRLTPLARSFISIPAGVLGHPLRTYVPLTLLASLIWCFGFAGAGWALGSNWTKVHDNFRYLDVAVVVVIVLGLAWLLLRRRRSSPATG